MKKEDVNIFESFAYQVYYSSRMVLYTWKQLMRRNNLEISNGQWIALNRLYHEGEMFQSEFVQEMFNDRPSVARMIASLEKKGLIIREQDSFDKRKYLIRLTPEGIKLHHRLSDIVKKDRQRLYKGLSSEDYLTLKNILSKLNRNGYSVITKA